MKKWLLCILMTMFSCTSFSLCTNSNYCLPAPMVKSSAALPEGPVPAMVNLMWMQPSVKPFVRFAEVSTPYQFKTTTPFGAYMISVGLIIKPLNHAVYTVSVEGRDSTLVLGVTIGSSGYTLSLNGKAQPVTHFGTTLATAISSFKALNTAITTMASQFGSQASKFSKLLDAVLAHGLQVAPGYTRFQISMHHDCAGTLIAYNETSTQAYVLTAAHCVSLFSNDGGVIGQKTASNLRVTFGDTWYDDLNQPPVYMVSKITRSSFYEGKTSRDHDFAILTIDNPPKNIKPFKLLGGENILDQAQAYSDKGNLIAVGWGGDVAKR
jgi:hypothetical protein